MTDRPKTAPTMTEPRPLTWPPTDRALEPGEQEPEGHKKRRLRQEQAAILLASRKHEDAGITVHVAAAIATAHRLVLEGAPGAGFGLLLKTAAALATLEANNEPGRRTRRELQHAAEFLLSLAAQLEGWTPDGKAPAPAVEPTLTLGGLDRSAK